MSVPHQTGRVACGDVSLHFRRLGTPGATPLLVVHGLSYFSYDWLEIAGALGSEREVLLPDTRGFGDSDWSPSQDYSVPTLGRDVLALLDHVGWRRAVLAGHSMGGRAATWVAANAPGRVAGLVLVEYSPENSREGSARVARSVGGTPEVFASVDEAMRHFGAAPAQRGRYEAYLRAVPGGLAIKRDTHFQKQFRRVLETGERQKPGVDMWKVIGDVRCPILSLRGTRSDMYSAEAAGKMTAANERLRVVEVDAGHDIGGENPGALLEVLPPFLASLG
jgi:pimeloyl-ACP methyl ester carboxylesterase